MIIIGIAGPARAGKDTAAKVIAHRFSLVTASFADPIKLMGQSLGLSMDQLYGSKKEEVDPRFGKSPRYILQTLGTEWGRELIHPDIWVQALERNMREALSADTNHLGYVIPDVRFPNEAEMVRRLGYLIHISRDARPQIANPAHISEGGINPTIDDYWLSNHTTLEDFTSRAELLCEDLAAEINDSEKVKHLV